MASVQIKKSQEELILEADQGDLTLKMKENINRSVILAWPRGAEDSIRARMVFSGIAEVGKRGLSNKQETRKTCQGDDKDNGYRRDKGDKESLEKRGFGEQDHLQPFSQVNIKGPYLKKKSTRKVLGPMHDGGGAGTSLLIKLEKITRKGGKSITREKKGLVVKCQMEPYKRVESVGREVRADCRR